MAQGPPEKSWQPTLRGSDRRIYQQTGVAGSMSKYTSREVRLASRPKGLPTAENFTLAQVELEPPQPGQVLVRNLYLSVDPYMRGRMNDRKSYVPPFELGKPLEGGAVGEVVESRATQFKPGDIVTSNLR